jgi:nucleotide-binding universal stress UspA family protein
MAAVDWAARDAEMRNIPLRLVHIIAPIIAPIEPAGGPWPEVQVPPEYSKLLEDEAKEMIDQCRRAVTEATSQANLQVSSEVVFAPIVSTLVELSKQAEMVVVGCRGRGEVARSLLGSVSSGVVHHAHCPVAVIHDEDPVAARRPQAPVLVGVDGSPTSELATAIAFDEASRRGVDLIALHAWSDMGPINFASVNWAPIEWRNIKDEEEEVLAERLSGWQEQYPDVVVHKVVVCDRPTMRLLEKADNAQLLVVGSHGRGGFPGMVLGSVSTTVVNSAQIPVIVARRPS